MAGGVTMTETVRQRTTTAPAAETTATSFPASAAAAPVASKSGKSEVWIYNGAFVVFTHIAALLSLALYRPTSNTLWMCLIVSQMTMMGITAGYHRLWSHQSFKASLPLRIFLAFWGTLGFQGSIRWWVLRHRLHHRFTDTDHDPYSSKKGFFYSHIGWIFTRPHYPRLKMIDSSDLDSDSVVMFQHRHYVPLALIAGFVLPTMVGAFWGDALGGFLYGGFVCRIVIWHSTFSINSVAHYFGEREYSMNSSARGNLICALLTNGEGHHNFHHEFPKDYRNGIKWYDWDPTKWFISMSNVSGLASELYQVPSYEIKKACVRVQEQHIQEIKSKLPYPPDPATLPVMTAQDMDEYNRRWNSSRDPIGEGERSKILFIIDGFVVDAAPFADHHPGGKKILMAYRGKDATTAFHGGVNLHTESAASMTDMIRVARFVAA